MEASSWFSPLGEVASVEKTTQGIVLAVGEEKFRADVLRPDLLRLKISQAGQFDDTPTYAASFQEPAPSAFRVTETAQAVTLDTGRLRLVITRRPFALDAYRSDGSVIFEDVRDAAGNGGYSRLNDAFMVNRRIAPHDAIYGLGEKTGHFDRRGRRYILWNTDVLAENVLRVNRLHQADQALTVGSTYRERATP